MSTLTASARAYADDHIARVLGFPVDPARVDDRTREQVFRELSRTPEIESSLRDAWGNWDSSFGDSNLRGELYRPWLDRPLVAMRESLRREHPERAPEPAWPGGKRFAVCLTHDVDVITLNPSLSGAARALQRDAGWLLREPRDRANGTAV